LYRETHNAYEILYREGKNRAVHSLPTAFIKLSEESERSCHGLWSLSTVYESYRRTVSANIKIAHMIKQTFFLLFIGNAVFAQIPNPFYSRTDFSSWEKSYENESKKEYISRLNSLSIFTEEILIYGQENLENRFTIADFNNDGLDDIIYFGYIGGSESEFVVFFQRTENGFKEILKVAGYPVEVSKPNLIKNLHFTIKNYPCCADIVSVIESYAPLEISNEFKYIVQSKYAFIDLKISIFPETFFEKPIHFKTLQEKYTLRFVPEINDSTFYHIDIQGNSAGIYPKGSIGVALSEKKDSTGRVWWFVYMKNNLKPIEDNLHKGSNNEQPYYSFGWISSRYIEEIK
jgi:hypothetical protein